MHEFWNLQEPQPITEMVNFTKNMALQGTAPRLRCLESKSRPR